MNRRERRRQRALARKRGIDPGYEHARMKDVREAAEVEVKAIINDAVEAGTSFATLAIVVLDPSSILFQEAIEDGKMRTTDRAAVTIVQREFVSKVMRHALEGGASMAEDFERLPTDCIPTVTFAGNALKVDITRRTLVSSEMQGAIRKGSNGEYHLNARGILRVMYDTDEDDLKEGPMRERMAQFLDTAKTGYERERRKANPRPLDDFLYEEFGGKAMEDAIRRATPSTSKFRSRRPNESVG